MSYFHYINNGKGPTKLFVGGIHGSEGETSIKFLNSLKKEDFAKGKIYIFNFNKTRYISTLNEDYFNSDIGMKLLNLIKKLKPDFYTELHCYNLDHFQKLTSDNRVNLQGVPPLIHLRDYILISSVSPLIRTKYFTKNTICKTLEIPCFDKLDKNTINKYKFNKKIAIDCYENIIKLIAISSSRKDFENKMLAYYPKQVELATRYAKEIFGENFPPY